jgi:hypothetical protein
LFVVYKMGVMREGLGYSSVLFFACQV